METIKRIDSTTVEVDGRRYVAEKKINFKFTVSDRFCTYEFPLDIPGSYCINDIAKKTYNAFGLPFVDGKLTERY